MWLFVLMLFPSGSCDEHSAAGLPPSPLRQVVSPAGSSHRVPRGRLFNLRHLKAMYSLPLNLLLEILQCSIFLTLLSTGFVSPVSSPQLHLLLPLLQLPKKNLLNSLSYQGIIPHDANQQPLLFPKL